MHLSYAVTFCIFDFTVQTYLSISFHWVLIKVHFSFSRFEINILGQMTEAWWKKIKCKNRGTRTGSGNGHASLRFCRCIEGKLIERSSWAGSIKPPSSLESYIIEHRATFKTKGEKKKTEKKGRNASNGALMTVFLDNTKYHGNHYFSIFTMHLSNGHWATFRTPSPPLFKLPSRGRKESRSGGGSREQRVPTR